MSHAEKMRVAVAQSMLAALDQLVTVRMTHDESDVRIKALKEKIAANNV